MKKVLLLVGLVFAFSMTGCAGQKGDMGLSGVSGTDGMVGADYIPPAVTTEQADINALVDDENSYRLSLGQTWISNGLTCTVQSVSAGQWLSSSSPGYNSGQGVVVLTGSSYSYLFNSVFNQLDGPAGPNSILPVPLQPLFLSNNYRISCSGFIVVRTTAYYNFDLSSDDGSILTVDGTQVINNDGNHGMTSKTGTKLLRRGVRSFSLLYAQTGAGSFGLVLKANGSLIGSQLYFH